MTPSHPGSPALSPLDPPHDEHQTQRTNRLSNNRVSTRESMLSNAVLYTGIRPSSRTAIPHSTATAVA